MNKADEPKEKRKTSALPCRSCLRLARPREGEEVKTLSCFVCGWPLPTGAHYERVGAFLLNGGSL